MLRHTWSVPFSLIPKVEIAYFRGYLHSTHATALLKDYSFSLTCLTYCWILCNNIMIIESYLEGVSALSVLLQFQTFVLPLPPC